MKKINKNKRNNLLLKGFTFLMLTLFSQSMLAQDDPLVIEGETVKIKKLDVKDNVIIGTKTEIQDAKLHVTGNLRVTEGVSIGAVNLFDVDDVNIPGGRLRITKEGNVGIGTTAPVRKLEVNGAIKLTNNGLDTNDGVLCVGCFGPGLNIVGIETDKTHRKIMLFGEITQQQNLGTNYWDGNQYFVGNVGIGAPNPKARLDVNGNLRVVQGVSIGGANRFEVDAPDNTTGGRFVITESGNVGIGHPNPDVPLSVKAETKNYSMLSLKMGMKRNPNQWLFTSIDKELKRSISIVANGDIVSTTAIYVTSDKRLKKNIHPTISLADLECLKAIEIVDYKKIDTIADNRRFKKVIAQQVQKVYPLAVQQSTQDFIPSVFQASASIDKLGAGKYLLSVANSHKLAVEDILELKCYPGNKSEQVTVSKIISPTKFEVQSTTALDTLEYVFVYGKQVDDLLSVDYDAIAMLNVSATQELAKQLEVLQSENQALTKRVTNLEKQLEDLEAIRTSVSLLQAQLHNETGEVSNMEQPKK